MHRRDFDRIVRGAAHPHVPDPPARRATLCLPHDATGWVAACVAVSPPALVRILLPDAREVVTVSEYTLVALDAERAADIRVLEGQTDLAVHR